MEKTKNQTQEDSHNLGHGAFIVYPQLRTVLVLNITIPVVCMATKKVAATPSSKVSMSGNRSRWLLLKAAFLRRINATVTNILDSEYDKCDDGLWGSIGREYSSQTIQKRRKWLFEPYGLQRGDS